MKNDYLSREGGAAFPVPKETFGAYDVNHQEEVPDQGMTLAEYYVGQVLPALVQLHAKDVDLYGRDATIREVVAEAWQWAEAAVLEGRVRRPGFIANDDE